MDLSFYSVTEKGKRPKNEDAVLSLHLGPGTFFFAVADGMGGVKGGEVASNLVLQEIQQEIQHHFSTNFVSPSSIKLILAKVFNAAHKAIQSYLKSHPDYNGMGTTLTALLILGDHYVWGNIGDSRIYHISNNEVRRITKDHNLLEDNPNGNIKNNDFIAAQYGNVLTRVVDGTLSKPDLYPKLEPYRKIEHNTLWVLCSDGLIVEKEKDYEAHLSGMISTTHNLRALARSLVKDALSGGSSDNISVILVRVDYKTELTNKLTKRIRINRKSKKKPFLVALVVFVFIFSLSLLYYLNIISTPKWIKIIYDKVQTFFVSLLEIFL